MTDLATNESNQPRVDATARSSSPDQPTQNPDKLPRSLTILFERDVSRDRQDGKNTFVGYQIRWPDRSPVAIALESFCTRGQRLLGLDRQLTGCQERLIDIICFPLNGKDDPFVRQPGHRVRRFFLDRQGKECRLHFLNGTPTETVFEIGRDDERILNWCGIHQINDGDRQWVDIATQPTPCAAIVAAA